MPQRLVAVPMTVRARVRGFVSMDVVAIVVRMRMLVLPSPHLCARVLVRACACDSARCRATPASIPRLAATATLGDELPRLLSYPEVAARLAWD